MKKIAPHIRNKQGGMLMLTLIVFMVILILGMTMITSMLYSQGENTMQINEQKAYYAAQSAVEAVKSYFLSSESNTSTTPHDLIGATGTYSLKDQGIDEDTTVELSISRDKENEQYILITAKGTCQGEESTVTARMIEEVKEGGSGGLYGSQAVLASTGFTRNYKKDCDLNIIGNIFIDDANMWTGINIHSVDFTKTDERGQGGNLFIHSEQSSARIQNNKLKNIFYQSKSNGQIDINSNEQIDNIYFQELPGSTGSVNFHSNTVREEAQFLMNSICPSILDSKIGRRLILSVPIVPKNALQNNEVDEIYIQGAKNIPQIGSDTKKYTIRELHTDAITYDSQPYVAQIIQEDLSSFILNCEQQIMNVMKGLEQMSEVLKNKPQWTRPDAESSFIKIEPGEGAYAQASINKKFEEYYDPNRKIRLIFTNYQGYSVITKKSPSPNIHPDYNEATYFISDDPRYAEDQIFFIAEKAAGVNFDTSSEDRFESLYVYAPNAQCQFNDSFQYLKGSIIAKNIIIDPPIQGTLIFKEPENIEGIGVPGGTDSTGASSNTSYTYHFEEYIESDKNQS